MTSEPTEAPPPREYKCVVCGAEGVRLWRMYKQPLFKQTLMCKECSLTEQRRASVGYDDTIGWRVPAMPTKLFGSNLPDGYDFYDHKECANEHKLWWLRLPVEVSK